MSKPISKGTIALIFFGAVIVVLVLGTLSSYNGLISKEETVNTEQPPKSVSKTR